ncbi:di-heme oxidoredictase family protein [Teredinibacter haidensis]|uniref:di-heme oxidoreductase family protein n=1 Tax=Teredinibacter haidensis TaxID=2731755 RepID=UPI000949083F|nr:di-heme oxidoredictase family protein [Teredinibacter haidensis]
MKNPRRLVVLAAVLLLVACGGGGGSTAQPTVEPTAAPTPTLPPAYLQYEYKSGGEASVARSDEDAFSQSPDAITNDLNDDAVFKQGNFLFRNAHKGEGPLLNNHTCQGCHIKDGRGNPPLSEDEAFTSMLVRLSLGNDGDNNPIPDPIYGTQLQTFGAGLSGELVEASYRGALDEITTTGEAYAFIRYDNIDGQYADGSTYQLQKPIYYLKKPAYGDFSEGLLTSPRVASPMIGLGLLEAIPETELLALADPNDSNNDGISGRARMITNNTTGVAQVGRFGWKASTGSVLQQSAGAYLGDIGLTNKFNASENCTSLQVACNARADTEELRGADVDIRDIELAFVEFYSRLLAVPERRGYDSASETWDEGIAAGRDLFDQSGCGGCHVRHHQTGAAVASIFGTVETLSTLVESDETISVLSDQHIWPHTDLLLHDMGGSCQASVRETLEGESCTEGESCLWVKRCEGLADGRPDGEASGSEWRTSALWGLGLVKTVNPKAGFLHDGRARTIEEAILWHDGEAANAQQTFVQMPATDRENLLAYLHSL